MNATIVAQCVAFALLIPAHAAAQAPQFVPGRNGGIVPCDHPDASVSCDRLYPTPGPRPVPNPQPPTAGPIDPPPFPGCHPHNPKSFLDPTCLSYWIQPHTEDARPEQTFVKGRRYKHAYPQLATIVILSVERDIYNRTLITAQVIEGANPEAFSDGRYQIGQVLVFYAWNAPWAPAIE